MGRREGGFIPQGGLGLGGLDSEPGRRPHPVCAPQLCDSGQTT